MFNLLNQFILFLYKRAKSLAMLWTLLIFVLCFIPSKGLPDWQIPFFDKWTHFILFAIFAFLWLNCFSNPNWITYISIFLVSFIFGFCVEWLQGLLTFLGRSQDNWDILADLIGGVIGVIFFMLFRYWLAKAKIFSTNSK